MKKFVMFLIAIIILAAVGIIAYRSFHSLNSFVGTDSGLPVIQSPATVPANQSQPASAKNILSAVSDGDVFDFWQDASSNIFYIKNDGGIYRVGNFASTSVAEKIGMDSTGDLYKISSAQNGSVLVGHGAYDARTWSLFDPQKNSWRALKTGAEEATWSPDGKKIAYMDKGGNLFVKNASNFADTKITNLNQVDGELQWFDPNFIEIIGKPTNFSPNYWARLNVNDASLNLVQDNINGLIMRFSSPARFGLVFSSQNFDSKLQIIDKKINILQTLSFTTLPEKCAFAGDFLYCAIPRNTKPRLRLPDDYLSRDFYSIDDIYGFNTKTGDVSLVWSADQKLLDAWHVEPARGGLLFINRYDQKLYQISL